MARAWSIGLVLYLAFVFIAPVRAQEEEPAQQPEAVVDQVCPVPTPIANPGATTSHAVSESSPRPATSAATSTASRTSGTVEDTSSSAATGCSVSRVGFRGRARGMAGTPERCWHREKMTGTS